MKISITLRNLIICLATLLSSPLTQAQNLTPQIIQQLIAADVWRTNFNERAVNLQDIVNGGPGKDGIPAIRMPQFVPIHQAKDIGAYEPLVTVALNGEIHAYPLRILIWHELVNDVVGDVPILVSYCPLCNSAIVFDRRTNTETLEFGVTGMLHKSNLLMYDQQSHSWWQQFTGKAVVGAQTHNQLDIITSRVESFNFLKTRHPNAKILIPPIPPQRNYGKNPYINYDTSPTPFLYHGDYKGDIPPLSYVVVIDKKAWQLKDLREYGEIIDGDIIIRWVAGQNSVLDTENIRQGRDIGNITAQKNNQDVPYIVTFAFVYHAFFSAP